MAYIAPSSTIQFMKNTGLSMTHENSLYFSSESAKNSYWNSYVTSSGTVGLVNQSYQRLNRNYCRVQAAMSQLFDADYMRFLNSSFENKWFYAFVTGINYINNNTVEIEYVPDPVMTWMGSFILKQCFIERQHTLGDAIGANIADEGISVGSYIDENIRESENLGRDACSIRVVYSNPSEIDATNYGGVYNPCKIRDFSGNGAETQAANFIQELVNSDLIDNIVDVLMVPSAYSNPGSITTKTVEFAKPYTTVAGYKPKNNKLFVYPYKYLLVDNSEGSTKEYKYEYFNTVPDTASSGNYSFSITGISATNPQVKCFPTIYNMPIDIATEIGYTDEYSLGMSHFPECAWSTDNYKAYLAQKNAYLEHDTVASNPQMSGAVIGAKALEGINLQIPNYQQLTSPYMGTNTALYTGTSAMPASILGAAGGALGATAANFGRNIANASKTYNQVQSALVDNIIQPEGGTSIHGSSCTDLTFAQGQKRFIFHEKSITKNYAIMIDDYFTMYGYRIGQVGTPNMNARPHWTYVKTIGCDVGGSVPASDKREIENAFDSGIRFWHNLTEMGNYSLDNSPA